MLLKKVVKKLVVGTFVIALLGGTVAYGEEIAPARASHSYEFSLDRGASGTTTLVQKTSSYSYATVARTGPALTTTTAEFMVVNTSGYQASSSEYIYGIGTAYPSYSGYSTGKGDYVRLKVTNPAGINSGSYISASGDWMP